MIIVDRALQERERQGRPVRVAIVGAGFMGRRIVNQIVNHVPGMRIVGIANRTLANAERACREAGISSFDEVISIGELERASAAGRTAITNNATILCDADGIDVILEVTGTIEPAAHIVLRALQRGKHVVLMNAELDATVGPILKTYADRAGVILSACDGDQPGVQMNLYRFVRSIGLEPLVCGNVKGLHDPYRNPTTQAGFAVKWGQDPRMVTSFADGTKVSFEQTIVANGTGMCVARRGMVGRFHAGHVDELTAMYDVGELRRLGGVVDYIVGGQPSPGVFILAAPDDPAQCHCLDLYKLGAGPLYSFYTPYHLCHFEVPLSLARVVLFADPVLTPLDGPRVDVVATAKTDLGAGTVLDGIGGYHAYGQCENFAVAARAGLLPMGVAAGSRLRRDRRRDTVLRYEDVDLPDGRLVDKLRAEQAGRWS